MSAVLHAAVVGTLVWRTVDAGPAVPGRAHIEIRVVPAPVSVPVPDPAPVRDPAPAPAAASASVAPSASSTNPPARAQERPAAKAQPTDSGGHPPDTMMRMRVSGAKADPAETAPSVPMPWGMPKDYGPAPPDDPLALGPAPRVPMQSTHQDHLQGAVGDGDGGYRKDRIAFSARTDRDGTIHFKDKPNIAVDRFGLIGGVLPGLMGHFDLTDALMRLHGEDPYRYEKYKYMEQTRDERAKMAVADREVRLREAVHKMPAYLAKVWAHAGWTEPQRRRLLFELWDEVAEEGDDTVVTTGMQVRSTIDAFIRRSLPAGSPQAYTELELRQLNGIRKSRAWFDPYR